ncbi:MAG: 23S rRNA (guanosine(2251)-2'-O)-methyltransferase RlmB [Gammaproteobacteria bacterium]|nr:23S rRNA (guanosine(2251)-2'-O)-methyltransferase RlmB [Gammaproteobacteria bacterium]
MMDFIYGIHATRIYLSTATGTPQRLLLKSGNLGPRLREIRDRVEMMDCPVEYLSRAALDEITPGKHQGVILYTTSPIEAVSLDVLLAKEVERDNPRRLFLILDGVKDPHNLGACLRSAATMGVDAVIAPRSNSAPLSVTAIKTACGGANLVPYLQVSNLARTLEQLKSSDCWILGTTLDAERPLSSFDLTGDLVLVMGSEDGGLRRNTRKHCDYLAKIPMVNDILGFNVSVATGISLYEVQQQRGIKG